jgi:hypothetical protein
MLIMDSTKTIQLKIMDANFDLVETMKNMQILGENWPGC